MILVKQDCLRPILKTTQCGLIMVGKLKIFKNLKNFKSLNACAVSQSYIYFQPSYYTHGCLTPIHYPL